MNPVRELHNHPTPWILEKTNDAICLIEQTNHLLINSFFLSCSLDLLNDSLNCESSRTPLLGRTLIATLSCSVILKIFKEIITQADQ